MNLGKRLAEGQKPTETQIQVRKEKMAAESQFEEVEKADREVRKQRKAEVTFSLLHRSERERQR